MKVYIGGMRGSLARRQLGRGDPSLRLKSGYAEDDSSPTFQIDLGSIHPRQVAARHMRNRLLVQQQLRGLHAAAAVEPALHDIVAEEVGDRSRLMP